MRVGRRCGRKSTTSQASRRSSICSPEKVSAVGLRILLERDRRGRGRLVGRVYDARWRPRSISQFITNHTMLGSGMVNRRVSLGFSGRPCRVNVYLDGVRLARGNVDAFVLPIEVGGVEVYRGAASLPGEFAGSDSRCGVVAIWTK